VEFRHHFVIIALTLHRLGAVHDRLPRPSMETAQALVLNDDVSVDNLTEISTYQLYYYIEERKARKTQSHISAFKLENPSASP
jgi:hypothetical protein